MVLTNPRRLPIWCCIMTAGSGWPSTAVNAGSMSTACGCQQSSSETAGRLPSGIRSAGSDWYSSSAGRRPHHRDSATYPRRECDRGLPRPLRCDHRTGVASRNPRPVSHRPDRVSRNGRSSRPICLPCRRNRNHPGLTHRLDQVDPRSIPPDHFGHASPHRNRVNAPVHRHNHHRPDHARPRRHRPRSYPPTDFQRPRHHRHPRRRRRGRNRLGPNRNRLGRNRNRPPIGANLR